MSGMFGLVILANVNDVMKRPTWTSYFLRIGGVSVVFSAAILIAREFFPGSEGFVVLGLSFFLLLVFVGIDVRSGRKNRKNNR